MLIVKYSTQYKRLHAHYLVKFKHKTNR